MRVRVFDVIGLKFCAETFVEHIDELIERARLSGAEIVNSTPVRFERENASFHHVLHINEIALLIAMLENARALPRLYLLREMINHARRNAFVPFARTITFEIAQPDDDPRWILMFFAHL